MGVLTNIVCPVSDERVDSRTSRITVFLNAALLAAYLATGWPWFVVLVAVDYAVRAFGPVEASPIRWIAVQIVRLLGIKPKMVDAAPKLFASRVGTLFAVASALLFPYSLTASMIAAGILCLFALLDSLANFCVGCLTYTYVVFPLLGRGRASAGG